MIPGFSQELMPKGPEKESQAKFKKFMTMMDSMTNEGVATAEGISFCFVCFIYFLNIFMFFIIQALILRFR